jgi:hypothetical protein
VPWRLRMAGRPPRRSVGDMSIQHDAPTLRECVEQLEARLARVGAAATTLHNLAPEIRHGIPPSALVKLTEQLERDLVLAANQLELVHERAVLELSSLRDVPGSR